MDDYVEIKDRISIAEERNTYDYMKRLDKLFKDLQKIERDLIILLKERRKSVQLGFDTLIMREDAANMLGLSTRQLDRITHACKIPVYKTIYGTRYRMGDVIAYGQMRGEVNSVLLLKKFNPWSKRMTDLDKLMGQLMNVDISHAPMDIADDSERKK